MACHVLSLASIIKMSGSLTHHGALISPFHSHSFRLVEEAVSVGDVVLFKKEASLVELALPDVQNIKTVEEIELPEDAALAAIVNDGRVA